MRPIRSPAKIIAYCATCKEEYGQSDSENLGVRFLCPKDDPADPAHITAVVKDEAGKFWLRSEVLLRTWELGCSPRRWFGEWRGLFTGRTGLYVGLRLLFLLIALVINFYSAQCENFKTLLRIMTWAFALLVIIDILLSTTSVAFISRFPGHPLQAAVLTLISFVSIAVAFAIFYVSSLDSFNVVLTPVSAIYFSLVTLATVGYGDIHVCSNERLYQLLIVLEIVVGLYFLVILLAIISSWSGARPREPAPVSLIEVLKNVA